MTVTHTDPTAAALLRAILLHPDDDTARLVYADWLDEHAEPPGECPKCTREGIPAVRQWALRVGCRHCHGTGTVSDGFAERAELIRVQIEWERADTAERATALVDRANELLTDARRRAWSGIKCPACDGVPARPQWRCTACDGTGFAPVEFRRGFVETVRCRMSDVLRFVPPKWDSPPTHELTPWARGVLAAHPVTAWGITDRQPERTNPMEVDPIPSAVRSWFRDDGLGVLRSEIPRAVFDELPGDGRHYVDDGEKCFRDEPEARDALAFAVGRVARRLAGLPEATP